MAFFCLKLVRRRIIVPMLKNMAREKNKETSMWKYISNTHFGRAEWTVSRYHRHQVMIVLPSAPSISSATIGTEYLLAPRTNNNTTTIGSYSTNNTILCDLRRLQSSEIIYVGVVVSTNVYLCTYEQYK